jgi:hypothetical protein
MTKLVSPLSYDQAVIIELDFAGQETLSTNEIYTSIKRLEENINKQLPKKSGIDGHDLATDEAIVYVYGPSADSIFKRIESVLRRSQFDHINITLQYGPPDNPKTRDKKFTL